LFGTQSLRSTIVFSDTRRGGTCFTVDIGRLRRRANRLSGANLICHSNRVAALAELNRALGRCQPSSTDEEGTDMLRSASVLAMAALLLAACGSSTKDRALSGAGIGAAAGAGTSAVTGGNPITGGLLGGAAGAAVGGLTDEDDVDLGDPVWNRGDDDDDDDDDDNLF
jgi:osmotically inducible lipoprotein OsmB